MVSADQSALEDGEKTFNGIGVDVPARVLALLVIHGVMLGYSHNAVLACIIGHDYRVFGNLLAQDRTESCGGNVRDVIRAHAAVALDKRENGIHVVIGMALLLACLAARECFVGFN